MNSLESVSVLYEATDVFCLQRGLYMACKKLTLNNYKYI